MRKSRLNIRHILAVVIPLIAIATSACGPSGPEPTSTMSVDDIYTAAFNTLSVQQATQLALTPPTSTPSPIPLPTLAPPPTLGAVIPFGSATTSAIGSTSGCDSSVYVNDVTIPDGTKMDPSNDFTKTWTVMNNGTCAWTTSYKLAFVSGVDMGGSAVPLALDVPVGQQAKISVDLTAPDSVGIYTGYWRLQNPQGQFFGDRISVEIKVTSGSGSDTETPTTGP
jgi:hypothetical protein